MRSKTLIPDFNTLRHREYQNPDISRALISMLCLIVFLLLAERTGHGEVALFGAFSAELIAWARVTGSFPQRVWIMILGSLAVAAASFLGTLAGASMPLSLLFVFLVAFWAGMARGLGDHGNLLGMLAGIMFLLSLHTPNTVIVAEYRAAAVLAGGALAILLRVLLLALIKPQLPYDAVISGPWTVGARTMALVPLLHQKPLAESERALHVEEIKLRNTITELLPYLRRTDNRTLSARRDLLIVVRMASRFGSTALALCHEMRLIDERKHLRCMRPALHEALNSLSQSADDLSYFLIAHTKKKEDRLIARLSETIKHIEVIQERMHANGLSVDDRIELRKVIHLFESSLGYLNGGLRWALSIREKRSHQSIKSHFMPRISIRSQWRQTLAELNLESDLFRHSLRLAVICVFSLWLFYLLEIPRGYWITLTVMMVLQPDFSGTRLKAWDRILGTVAGISAGSVFLYYVQSPQILLGVISASTFFFLYYSSRNYAIAAFFLTLEIITLISLSSPYDWHVGLYRLLCTLIGGIISIGAVRLLWPRWEAGQFRPHLAAGLRANERYLLQVGKELKAKTGYHPRLTSLRRKVEVINTNAADAIKRMRHEPNRDLDLLEKGRVMTFYNAKLTRKITAFAAILPGISKNFDYPVTDEVITECGQILKKLAEAIEQKEEMMVEHSFAPFFLNLDARIANIYAENPENDPQKQKTIEHQLTDMGLVRSQIEAITKEIGLLCSYSGNVELKEANDRK